MNFLKKLGISCYINAVAALLILVSMFLTIASSMNVGFSIDELGYIIAFSIIAILAIVGSYFLSLKFGNKLISYLPLLVAGVLAGLCFIFVLNARTYLIGTLWVTQLDLSNPYAVAAMNTGAPAFIMYCVSMVILAVGSFFNIIPEKKA